MTKTQRKKNEPVILAEDLPGGAYRKAVYQCFTNVAKRELTDNEHKYLSHILKMYVDSQVRVLTKHLTNGTQ